MTGWTGILYFAGLALAGWLVYRSLKANPAAYSKAAIFKSLNTMGVLALALIALIALCVFLLRQSA